MIGVKGPATDQSGAAGGNSGWPGLDSLFHPRSLAVIGVSREPQKWGFHLLFNLLAGGYKGSVFPVNPRGGEILGLRTYPSVAELPQAVDLAILVVPPGQILQAIRDCGKRRTKVGVVITSGFGEAGRDGKTLEEEMIRTARNYGMRLVGPNCQGIVSTGLPSLYAHMPPQFPPPGPIAVVSQSGNLATSIIELGESAGLGFSRIVSSGNEADLQTADFWDYLAEDRETEVILTYVEGIKQGRRFLQTSRSVSSRKPLLLVKAGQSEAGSRAALSHTGALSGSDEVFKGLCRQWGILRAETIEEMVDAAAALVTQPLPRGRRVGIVTMGGGWGVLAADYCSKAGLIVEPLSAEMIDSLNRVLPPWWNRMNPVDMVAGYRRGDLLHTLELFLQSARFDGVLMLGIGWRSVRGDFLRNSAPTPDYEMKAAGQAWMEEEEQIFQGLQDLGRRYEKPILLASDMVHRVAGFGEAVRRRRVAAYPTLRRAVGAYLGLVRRFESLGP